MQQPAPMQSHRDSFEGGDALLDTQMDKEGELVKQGLMDQMYAPNTREEQLSLFRLISFLNLLCTLNNKYNDLYYIHMHVIMQEITKYRLGNVTHRRERNKRQLYQELLRIPLGNNGRQSLINNVTLHHQKQRKNQKDIKKYEKKIQQNNLNMKIQNKQQEKHDYNQSFITNDNTKQFSNNKNNNQKQSLKIKQVYQNQNKQIFISNASNNKSKNIQNQFQNKSQILQKSVIQLLNQQSPQKNYDKRFLPNTTLTTKTCFPVIFISGKQKQISKVPKWNSTLVDQIRRQQKQQLSQKLAFLKGQQQRAQKLNQQSILSVINDPIKSSQAICFKKYQQKPTKTFNQNLVKNKYNFSSINNNQPLPSLKKDKKQSPFNDYQNIFEEISPLTNNYVQKNTAIQEIKNKQKQNKYNTTYKIQDQKNSFQQNFQNHLQQNQKLNLSEVKQSFKNYSQIFLKGSSLKLQPKQQNIAQVQNQPIRIKIQKKQKKNERPKTLSSDSEESNQQELELSQPSIEQKSIIKLIKNKISTFFSSQNKSQQLIKQSPKLNKQNILVQTKKQQNKQTTDILSKKNQNNNDKAQQQQKQLTNQIQDVKNFVIKSVKIVSNNIANVQNKIKKDKISSSSSSYDFNNISTIQKQKPNLIVDQESQSEQQEIKIIKSIKQNNNSNASFKTISENNKKQNTGKNFVIINKKNTIQPHIIQIALDNIMLPQKIKTNQYAFTYEDLSQNVSTPALSVNRYPSASSYNVTDQQSSFHFQPNKYEQEKQSKQKQIKQTEFQQQFDLNVLKNDQDSSEEEQILVKKVAKIKQKLSVVQEQQMEESKNIKVIRQTQLNKRQIKKIPQQITQLQNQLLSKMQEQQKNQNNQKQQDAFVSKKKNLQKKFPTEQLVKQKNSTINNMLIDQIVTDVQKLKQKIISKASIQQINQNETFKNQQLKSINNNDNSNCRSFHLSNYVLQNSLQQKKIQSQNTTNQNKRQINSKEIYLDLRNLQKKMSNQMPKTSLKLKNN